MKKRRGWLFGVVIVAFLLGSAAWWNGRATYKRYVSPPLKDGTRYTFVYPSRMTTVRARSDIGKMVPPSPMMLGGVDVDDCVSATPSALQKWLNRV